VAEAALPLTGAGGHDGLSSPRTTDVTGTAPILRLDDVAKTFGGLRAVNGCTFTVAEGSITALIGPNGAGKTTVFNLVTGLLRPDRGDIRFRGRAIGGLPAHRIARAGLSRTFQIPRELERLTVLENVLLWAKSQSGERLDVALVRRGRFRAEERVLRERAERLLDLVELTRLRDEYASHLSGGQKKLLELARALMAEPALVLLDEPGAGVNPVLMQKLLDAVRAENRAGRTFLVIEHDMDLVAKLCHPVIVMSQGKKLTEGSLEDVRRDDTVLEHYFGRVHGE
jgi:branched-chain amino acid transport system ATP-binding protein